MTEAIAKAFIEPGKLVEIPDPQVLRGFEGGRVSKVGEVQVIRPARNDDWAQFGTTQVAEVRLGYINAYEFHKSEHKHDTWIYPLSWLKKL